MEIPYIVVHCKRGHRNQFPQSTIEPPCEHLAVRSKDSLSVTVSGYVCKGVDSHTIQSLQTRIGTEDTVESQTQRPAYGFEIFLECGLEDCQTPVGVIAPRNHAMTPEEIAGDVSTLEWGDICCPSGHPIPLVAQPGNTLVLRHRTSC